jgi:hypothetical protein
VAGPLPAPWAESTVICRRVQHEDGFVGAEHTMGAPIQPVFDAPNITFGDFNQPSTNPIPLRPRGFCLTWLGG